jgi:3-deoxy-D-manno-octulosonic-acid transferase
MLDRIGPSMVLIVETDVWPNMIDCLRQRRIPVLLVNARLSDRSLRGYRRLKGLTAALFPRLTGICTQTDEDARRFEQLGVSADRLMVTGNLKFDQTYEAISDDEKVQLQQRLGIAPDAKVIVAGSTHAGEENIIAEAFRRVRRHHPGLVLINAPRNPQRAKAIAAVFNQAGLNARLLSEVDASGSLRSVEVVIVDAIGLLVKLYALSDVAVVGGSLLDIRGIGGHNPLEPAAFAKPIIFGHNMRNFRQIAGMLESSGAALVVADTAGLSRALRSLLDDTNHARELGLQAYRIFNVNKGAVTRTADLALQILNASDPL